MKIINNNRFLFLELQILITDSINKAHNFNLIIIVILYQQGVCFLQNCSPSTLRIATVTIVKFNNTRFYRLLISY